MCDAINFINESKEWTILFLTGQGLANTKNKFMHSKSNEKNSCAMRQRKEKYGAITIPTPRHNS